MAVRKTTHFLAPAIFALTLSSCAVSLGVFDSKSDGYKSYYDSFGSVKCLYDGGQDSYDVEDSLFNDTTMKSMGWEEEGDKVESREYLYLILPFKEALTVESISLCFKAEAAATLEMSLFYFFGSANEPQKVRYLTSPEYEPIYDSEGNEIGQQPIDYDDPPNDIAMIHGELAMQPSQWASVVFGDFKQPGYEDNYLHTGSGGSLYFRVENNSGWNLDRLSAVEFTFINLLVRAI